mmetsp:Transcript_18507/g.43935  ORF Transcript_18507/g.43935 Transcript_18507/m.43935 type:complete len:246 (-) Transcript_18507:1185-1922(-)
MRHLRHRLSGHVRACVGNERGVRDELHLCGVPHALCAPPHTGLHGLRHVRLSVRRVRAPLCQLLVHGWPAHGAAGAGVVRSNVLRHGVAPRRRLWHLRGAHGECAAIGEEGENERRQDVRADGRLAAQGAVPAVHGWRAPPALLQRGRPVRLGPGGAAGAPLHHDPLHRRPPHPDLDHGLDVRRRRALLGRPHPPAAGQHRRGRRPLHDRPQAGPPPQPARRRHPLLAPPPPPPPLPPPPPPPQR